MNMIKSGCNVLLLSPRFPDNTFWNNKATCGEGGGDQCTLGLNFETRRPRRDVLADYKRVVETIYTPAAFFSRIDSVMRHLNCYWPPSTNNRPRWRVAGLTVDDWLGLWRLLSSALRRHPRLITYYLKALHTCARVNPGALPAVGAMIAFYLHLGPFSKVVSAAMARQIDEIDSGRWRDPLTSLPSRVSAQEFLDHVQRAARAR